MVMSVKNLVNQNLFLEKTALMNVKFPNNFILVKIIKKFVSVIAQQKKAFIKMKVMLSICAQIHAMLISKI